MKHFQAILLLPFMVTVVIPLALLALGGPDTFGLWRSAPLRVALSVVSACSIGLGLVLMGATIRLFATVGQGTLATWNPTQRLVLQGVYRHVRNPMISGVLAVLPGEALLSASLPIACWFLAFLIVDAVSIPLAEERGLAARSGDDYQEYRRNAPRWIPRLKAWTPGETARL